MIKEDDYDQINNVYRIYLSEIIHNRMNGGNVVVNKIKKYFPFFENYFIPLIASTVFVLKERFLTVDKDALIRLLYKVLKNNNKINDTMTGGSESSTTEDADEYKAKEWTDLDTETWKLPNEKQLHNKNLDEQPHIPIVPLSLKSLSKSNHLIKASVQNRDDIYKYFNTAGIILLVAGVIIINWRKHRQSAKHIEKLINANNLLKQENDDLQLSIYAEIHENNSLEQENNDIYAENNQYNEMINKLKKELINQNIKLRKYEDNKKQSIQLSKKTDEKEKIFLTRIQEIEEQLSNKTEDLGSIKEELLNIKKSIRSLFISITNQDNIESNDSLIQIQNKLTNDKYEINKHLKQIDILQNTVKSKDDHIAELKIKQKEKEDMHRSLLDGLKANELTMQRIRQKCKDLFDNMEHMMLENDDANISQINTILREHKDEMDSMRSENEKDHELFHVDLIKTKSITEKIVLVLVEANRYISVLQERIFNLNNNLDKPKGLKEMNRRFKDILVDEETVAEDLKQLIKEISLQNQNIHDDDIKMETNNKNNNIKEILSQLVNVVQERTQKKISDEVNRTNALNKILDETNNKNDFYVRYRKNLLNVSQNTTETVTKQKQRIESEKKGGDVTNKQKNPRKRKTIKKQKNRTKRKIIKKQKNRTKIVKQTPKN